MLGPKKKVYGFVSSFMKKIMVSVVQYTLVWFVSENLTSKVMYFKTLNAYLIPPTGPVWCEISCKHLKAQ